MNFFDLLGQKIGEILLDFDNFFNIQRECLSIQLSTLYVGILGQLFIFSFVELGLFKNLFTKSQ